MPFVSFREDIVIKNTNKNIPPELTISLFLKMSEAFLRLRNLQKMVGYRASENHKITSWKPLIMRVCRMLYPSFYFGTNGYQQKSMVVSGSLNRWYIINQLAVYTTYIPLIANWVIICYLPNQETPLKKGFPIVEFSLLRAWRLWLSLVTKLGRWNVKARWPSCGTIWRLTAHQFRFETWKICNAMQKRLISGVLPT